MPRSSQQVLSHHPCAADLGSDPRQGARAYRYLPVILFGVTSIAAGLLALLLPETKGKALPDTIEQGEVFGT